MHANLKHDFDYAC